MRREGKRFAFCLGPCETTGRPERKPILFLTILHRSRSWVSTVRWDVINLILLFSYSLLLYNLAKGKRSNPPLQVVRSWVDEINKVAKTKLSCTPAVYTTRAASTIPHFKAGKIIWRKTKTKSLAQIGVFKWELLLYRSCFSTHSVIHTRLVQAHPLPRRGLVYAVCACAKIFRFP